MKKLTKETFCKVENSIYKYARLLEKSMYEYYFLSGSEKKVINELRKFQNDDGGFARIESDFRMVASSPMATSVGLRYLSEFDKFDDAKSMIKKAIVYLENEFNVERNGWFVGSKNINNYPHAPWWHYNEDEGMTIIDKNWGNPTAELIAYLYKYSEYVEQLNVNELVEYAVSYIENKQVFESDNELFCYIRMYNVLPENIKQKLEKRVESAICQVIEYDESKWHEYVPTPIKFVTNPKNNSFGVIKSKIEKNLDYIVNQLENDNKIIPPWGESFYKGDLKPAYNEWIGKLTLDVLMILSEYKRIEK